MSKLKIFFFFIAINLLSLQNVFSSFHEELIGLVKLTKSNELIKFLSSNKIKINNIKNEIIDKDGIYLINIDIENEKFEVSNSFKTIKFDMFVVDANKNIYQPQNTLIFKPYLASQNKVLGEIFGINLERKILYLLNPNRSKKEEIKILEFVSGNSEKEYKKEFENLILSFLKKIKIFEDNFINQIKDLRKNTPKNMKKHILFLDEFSKEFEEDILDIKETVSNYNFNDTTLFDKNFLNLKKNFDNNFKNLDKYIKNDRLKKIIVRNDFYLKNKKLIDDKIVEVDILRKNIDVVINELDDKRSKLDKLKIYNSVDETISNFNSLLSNIKNDLLYDLSLSDIQNLKLIELYEYKKLIELNNNLDSQEIDKNFKRFVFYETVSAKVSEFFNNNIVLSFFLLIFLFIIFPILIWIYVIKKSIAISDFYNYNLIFSYSFLTMVLGTSLLSIDLVVNPNLINFTKIFGMSLLIVWQYLNIKNTKKNFIIFSFGQLFSFITLIFLFFLVSAILDKISKIFDKKK